MRSPLIAMALAALMVTLLPAGVQAHSGESGPIAVTDTIVLTAQGTISDTFHTFLSDMGIPGHEGETLRYFWSANNGSGPPVYFEIHEHTPPAELQKHYFTTAPTETGEWVIPGSADYMVLWRNLEDEPMEVQYSFSLVGAPPDYTVTIITLVAVGGFFAALWLVWRGKGSQSEEE